MDTERQLHFSREELLTASDVARILRVQRTTALDYMRRGVIPACKIGRRWYSVRSQLDAHLGELFSASSWSTVDIRR